MQPTFGGFHKSMLIFSKNCDENIRRWLGRFLGMEECHAKIHYLGNHLFLGRNRGKSFEKLERRVHEQLEGWMASAIPKWVEVEVEQLWSNRLSKVYHHTLWPPSVSQITFVNHLIKWLGNFGGPGLLTTRVTAWASWDSIC